MEFQVLGSLQVTVAGQPVAIGTARKRQVVLAVLLAWAGQPVPVDMLIAAVWGDRPPASARRNLQLYVHQLRRVLDGELISASGDGYAINPGDGLDSVRFRRLASAGSASLAAGDAITGESTLRTALDLWRGPAFIEFLDCEPVREEAQRLEALRLETDERWAEAQLATPLATPALLVELAELCRQHPYRETLRAHLMRALYQDGRRAEALAVFQETRALLVEQLGVEPGEALRRLHRRILCADPALGPVEAAWSGGSQVPRQLPMPPQLFTGRVRELAVLERVADASTVVISAIDGMAGVGKTALALHAAHQIAGRFPDGQLFIDLHGHTEGVEPVGPGEALDRMLRVLGVPGPQVPAGLDERAGLYRTRLADRRMMIVLDNAATEAQVAPLLLEPVPGRYRFHDLTRTHAFHTAIHDLAEPSRRAALGRLLDYHRFAASVAMNVAYPHERARRPRVPSARTPSPDLPDSAAALGWLDTELPNLLAIARYAAEHGRPQYVLQVSTVLHRHLRVRGRYHDAETLHHQALNAARVTGHQAGQLSAFNGLGDVHWAQGRYERAADHYGQALRLGRITGHRAGQQAALVGLGQLHLIRGRHEEAADYYRRLLDLARESGDRNFQFEATYGQGRLRRATGDPNAAITHHEEALALANELGQPIDQARARDELAQAYHSLNRRDQPRSHWQRALGILVGLGVEYTNDVETNVPAIRTHLSRLAAAAT